MSPPNAMQQVWQARTSRERGALATMVVVVLGALLVQTGWSAAQESARLARQTPAREQLRLRVEQAAAELQRPAGEARQGKLLAGEALDVALRRDLANLHGNVALRLTAPRKLELKGEAEFAALLVWLAQAQSVHGLFVSAAEIQRGAAGRAHVTLELSGT